MADERKIVVEISLKQDEDTIKNVTDNENEETKDTDSNILMKNIIVNQAYNLAKDTLIRAVDVGITRNLALREDYIGENIYNNAKVTINKVSNLATSVIGGAVTGGQAGVGGAIAGAIIGFAGWGIGEAFSINERQSNYARTLNASRYGSDFMQTRAGLINGGRGTEN